jgi:hypothetical protein
VALGSLIFLTLVIAWTYAVDALRREGRFTPAPSTTKARV